MDLVALKAQNAQDEEALAKETTGAEEPEVKLDAEGNPITEEPEVKLDAEGNPITKEVKPELDAEGNPVVELEPWQKVEEQDLTDVPATRHINMKRKLKGKVSDRDEKIVELEEENKRLLAIQSPKSEATEIPTRPKAGDYTDEALYENDLADYEAKLVEVHVAKVLTKKTSVETIEQRKKTLDDAVDEHYTRADTLIETTGIKPEVYKTADEIVRKGVEEIRPGLGELIVDQLIAVLGEGSEKVLYYVGRNAAALEKVKGLLATDPSGMKAAIFLGQQKERLTKITTRKSAAPDPSVEVSGDTTGGAQEKALHKKYKTAFDKGDSQEAYNLRKAAKAQKIDVSNW